MIQKIALILAVVVNLSFSTPAFAQDDRQTEIMDDAADAQEDLREAVQAKDPDKAERAATKIANLLVEVRAFWMKQQMDDIVKLADNSRDTAVDMAKLAKAGDTSKFPAALERLSAACIQCHDAEPAKRLKK